MARYLNINIYGFIAKLKRVSEKEKEKDFNKYAKSNQNNPLWQIEAKPYFLLENWQVHRIKTKPYRHTVIGKFFSNKDPSLAYYFCFISSYSENEFLSSPGTLDSQLMNTHALILQTLGL